MSNLNHILSFESAYRRFSKINREVAIVWYSRRHALKQIGLLQQKRKELGTRPNSQSIGTGTKKRDQFV